MPSNRRGGQHFRVASRSRSASGTGQRRIMASLCAGVHFRTAGPSGSCRTPSPPCSKPRSPRWPCAESKRFDRIGSAAPAMTKADSHPQRFQFAARSRPTRDRVARITQLRVRHETTAHPGRRTVRQVRRRLLCRTPPEFGRRKEMPETGLLRLRSEKTYAMIAQVA